MEMEISCFTCHKPLFISSDTNNGRPRAHRKDCASDLLFRKADNEWLINTRGYPQGYKSREAYENRNKRVCKQCQREFTKIKLEAFCTRKCSLEHKLSSTKATNLERYGEEFATRTSEVQEKAKQTCQERYGCDNASKSPVIIEKIAQTHLTNWGVRNIWQRRDIIEASYEKAFGEGITNPQQVKEINDKAFETRKERYELQGAVPKAALIEACLKNFGAEQFFGSEAGRFTTENLKSRYGYSDEDIEELNKSKANCQFSWYVKKYGDNEIAKTEYEKRLAQCDTSSYDWALKKANFDGAEADIIFLERQKRIHHTFGEGSKLSLKTFKVVEEVLIEKYGIEPDDIYVGDGTRKEWFLYDKQNHKMYFYDFTIRSKKIIIEFNGCYYHPKNRDENPEAYDSYEAKINFARESGFEVIVIWDDVKIKENQKFLIERVTQCLA